MGALFQLNGQRLQPAAGTRVLKAQEADLLIEANALIDVAKNYAARIAQEADAAFEERKAAGYEEGAEEARFEHAEKLIETALSSVEFIENIESTLVDVVSQAIRKVIGEMDDKDVIVRIVNNALAGVRNQQQVTVRVSSSDEQAVKGALAAMMQSSVGSHSFINVIADARLEKGSCILESELGVTDASLETQLKAFESAFRAKINHEL